MEQQFLFFENRLALLEGRINTLENDNVSLLGKVSEQEGRINALANANVSLRGKVSQQAVVHSFERHQFTQLMQQDAMIWAPFFVKITCCEVLMEELLVSKPNKNRERPRTAWYSDRKDEEHVISMAAKMGLEVEAFVTLADALIEERNLTAHFSFGERGRRVSDSCYLFRRFPQLKTQLPHHATIIELFGGPGKTTPRNTQFPAVTAVGQHADKGLDFSLIIHVVVSLWWSPQLGKMCSVVGFGLVSTPDKPNQITLELRNGLKVTNLVTKCSSELMGPGQFDTSEFSRQVFDNGTIKDGPPTVKASQNFTPYGWDATKNPGSKIEAFQTVAMFPLPGEWMDAMDAMGMDKPITVYKYGVYFTRQSGS